MSRLQISLLGPFAVTLDGEPVTAFGAETARALLAYLAAHGRTPCQRSTLAGLLWPDQPESEARHNLSTALNRLRQAIDDRAADPPFLHITYQTIGLHPDGDLWSDVASFADGVSTGGEHAYERLREAVGLYRGEFLSGFTVNSALFEEWLVAEREARHRQVLEALSRLAAHHEERSEHEQAIRCARRQVSLEPWHEGAHRVLMRALALSGERASALAQYEACARTLQEELDAEPSPETAQLYEQICTGNLSALRRERLLPDLAEMPCDNLPAQVTSFIGREQELAALEALLVDPAIRLVTVVGPGGMGKTRLAIETGRHVLSQSFDEVWLVELAPIPDEASVPRAVAGALGIQERQDRPLPEAIAFSLQTRDVLLVIDNCEHVIHGAAALSESLLARCPDLTVLATSREPLHVPGEHLYEIPPMALPETEETVDTSLSADALQLFCTRASAVRPQFAQSEETSPFIASICRRLDGMPLAIEMAAARLRALSLREIDRQIEDRFRLLTGGSRTALPRQQTLRNTVEWSYELLDEAERTLFDRLSVFAGGFSLEAATEVCSGQRVEQKDVLDLLSSLVDKSLVSTLRGPEGERRYRLLETLRAYGRERLAEQGEADEMARRHAWFYVALAESEERFVQETSAGIILALARLDAEEENLAAAMRWSLACRQPEVTIRTGGALWPWTMRRPHWAQYVEWLRQALPMGRDVAPLYRAKGLGHVSWYSSNMGQMDEAAERAQEALEAALAAEDARWIVRCHGLRGAAAYVVGDSDRAQIHHQKGMEIARQLNDPAEFTGALLFSTLYEPLERRWTILQEWLPHCPLSHRPWAQVSLAEIAYARGDLSAAENLFAQSLAGWEEVGSHAMQGRVSRALASIAWLCGNYDRVQHLLLRSRDLARRVSRDNDISHALQDLGTVAWGCNDQEQAALYLQEGLALARAHGHGLREANIQCVLALVACEEHRYGDAQVLCSQALDAMPEWAHDDLGLAFSASGRAALSSGETVRAVGLHCQAVGHAHQSEWRPVIVGPIEYLAWALTADGQHEKATQLLAVAARERDDMGIVLFPVDRPHNERAIETARKTLGKESFAAAWAEGETLSLDEAVAVAIGTDTP